MSPDKRESDNYFINFGRESGIISVLPAPFRDPSYVPTATIQRFMLPEA